MRKEYKKPILEEEKIELEDIVAASSEEIDINDIDHVLSNATHWGK